MNNDQSPKTPLVQLGEFKLSSGVPSSFRLEELGFCDETLKALAIMYLSKTASPSKVISVPSGGDRFAEIIKAQVKPNPLGPALFVEDVWTTGKSLMRKIGSSQYEYKNLPWEAVVLIARGEITHDSVTAMFTLNRKYWNI